MQSARVVSRIPPYDPRTPSGMRAWFEEMDRKGLLFHPEDAPSEVLAGGTWVPLFTPGEAAQAARVIARMTADHGHEAMIEACYPVAMRPTDGLLADAD